MAKIIDTRNNNGELLVIGRSITLPASSDPTINGSKEPNLGSLRYNNSSNAIEIYTNKNNAKEWKFIRLLGTANVLSDTNYSVQPNDTNIQFSTLTASRTITLPLSSSCPKGFIITIGDRSGLCSASRTITISPSSSDLINGIASFVLSSAYQQAILSTDSNGSWFIDTSTNTSTTSNLDGTFGTTQGSIIYRGATKWLALVPGSNGQILTTSGNNGNPTWANTAITSSTLDNTFGTSTGSIIARGASTWNAVSGGTAGQSLVSTGTNLPTWSSLNLSTVFQGRLTLTSGSPVLMANVNSSSTIYYTPYIGNFVSIWNGTDFIPVKFPELSLSLSGLSASSIYDVFVYLNGSNPTLILGPAWSANTTRTMSLVRLGGTLVNSANITNGPQTNYGTYIGTIATDNSTPTVTFNTGGVVSGAAAANVGIWNAYNRINGTGFVSDTVTTNWNYTTTNTWRAANSNNNIRINFVSGLMHDSMRFQYTAYTANSGAFASYIGMSLDSTSTLYMGSMSGTGGGQGMVSSGIISFVPLSGKHFVQAIEWTNGGTAIYGLSSGNGLASYGGLSWTGTY